MAGLTDLSARSGIYCHLSTTSVLTRKPARLTRTTNIRSADIDEIAVKKMPSNDRLLLVLLFIDAVNIAKKMGVIIAIQNINTIKEDLFTSPQSAE